RSRRPCISSTIWSTDPMKIEGISKTRFTGMPSGWLIGSSSPIGQDEGEAVVTCGLKVSFDRLVNLAERLPRVGTGVEPLKEQKINQHARHPVNRRLVANDRPATARLEEGSSESAAGVPSQDTAAAEVDEAVVPVVTAKGAAEPL